MTSIHVIVTAAGTGQRMGGLDKLLLPLAGQPLLIRTLSPFWELEGLTQVVVAVDPAREEEFLQLFARHGLTGPKLQVTSGGESRQQSIHRALEVANRLRVDDQDLVLIHDGARPLITQALISDLILALKQFDGVVPALPVRDTIKRVADGNRVLRTEDRETLRLVQTPQAFYLDSILKLHRRAASEGFIGTDDASLLEHYGATVGFVDGLICNLKVTYQEDISFLNFLFDALKETED